MDELKAVLGVIGLDPALFSLAISGGIGLRFARGMLHWFNSSWSFGTALLVGLLTGLGVAFAGGSFSLAGQPGTAAMGMTVAMLVVERMVRALASKVPWLPQDNEWSATPTEPKEPRP